MNTNKVYSHLRIAIVFALCILTINQPGSAQSAKPKTSIDAPAYGKASYDLSQAGKFMKTWLIAGPIAVSTDNSKPDQATQEKVFKSDVISVVNVAGGNPASLVVNQKDLKWQPVAWGDDMIDLDSLYNHKDYVYAYALAEIKSPTATNALLAVGSDDGIKIWLNGKLVHDNWIPRGVQKDDDIVPLKLEKGSNQLLLKVQDMEGGWGFVARLLDKTGLSDQLNNAIVRGNQDKIKTLIDANADINAADKNGMTPIVVAKVNGRDDVAQMLLQKGAKDQPVPSSEALVDDYYKSLNGKDAPGVAVLVAKDGKVLYRKGFGYADIKNKIPVTPDTKFRIGSVTKQFTAASILKLQENGLISVNDKLSKFIPDFPRGDEVTIHMLLTHISGIHSYTDKDGFLANVTKTISPDSLVNLIKKDPYDFNPGEQWRYNNSAFFILGYIVSKVSGKPYAQYLKETFFDPLHMDNTGVHYAGIKLQHEAKGYGRDGDKWSDALNWDMSWAGGAGSLYSTVDDLLKWTEALHAGKVLSEKSLAAMFTPVKLNNGEVQQYGYGIGFGKYRGEDFIGHSGGLHGFLTQLNYYKNDKLTVVMFTNTNQPEINFDPSKIAEAFLWDKMDKQKSYSALAVAPKNLQRFAGRYEVQGLGVLTVTTENDRIWAQPNGQPKAELFAMAENEFFLKVVDAKVKFLSDDKGEVNQIMITQNGQEIKGKKLPPETAIQVKPEILDQYVGKYKIHNHEIVTITRENNKLFAEPQDHAKVEMVPVSETDFVVKEFNAKVSFVKDANGKVTKMKVNMDGGEEEAPRVE